MRQAKTALMGLSVASCMICFVVCVSAKADTLSPTTSSGSIATFSGVTITYAGTNSVSSVFGNNGTTSTASESVTFTGIGTGLVGIQIGTLPLSNAGNGDAAFSVCSGASCLGTAAPFYVNFVASGTPGSTFSGLGIGGSGSAPTIGGGLSGQYDASSDQACYLNTGANFNACNTGADPVGVASISATGDSFTMQDASISFTFTLPTATTPVVPPTTPSSVPEPSSLFMAGIGLLAFLAFTLSRRAVL